MADRFASLTAFIPKLRDDDFGEWIIDRENDGTPEHPKRFPFVRYSGAVDDFIHALYAFCEAHPEFEHTRYVDTLNELRGQRGAASMEHADVENADAKSVIALLVGAVRAERFCDGALLGYLKDGSVVRWLERLAELDRA